ncbi:hypothetical protein EST38_g13909, partial [Candolleomyces aberdarensis]
CSHETRLAGAFILDIAYGLDVKNKDDVYIDQAERAMAAMAIGGTASSYLVDFIPSLKYLPSWLPGAQFKRDAKTWKQDASAMPRDCLQFVEDALKKGDARPCAGTILLEELDEHDGKHDEKKRAIHDVLGSMYAAVPHQLIQDDVYNGYHIPAGSTVIANVWAVAHDPAVYGPNPGKFDPSRFMNASQTEINPDMPMGYETFGYGRRVCPGLHIGVESVWLMIVSVLAVFDVKSAVDGELEGNQFWKYTSGLLSHPYPFKLRIVPRNPDAEAMIRNGVVTGV